MTTQHFCIETICQPFLATAQNTNSERVYQDQTLFIVAPIVCGGSVSVPCFVIQYVYLSVLFIVLQSS